MAKRQNKTKKKNSGSSKRTRTRVDKFFSKFFLNDAFGITNLRNSSRKAYYRDVEVQLHGKSLKADALVIMRSQSAAKTSRITRRRVSSSA